MFFAHTLSLVKRARKHPLGAKHREPSSHRPRPQRTTPHVAAPDGTIPPTRPAAQPPTPHRSGARTRSITHMLCDPPRLAGHARRGPSGRPPAPARPEGAVEDKIWQARYIFCHKGASHPVAPHCIYGRQSRVQGRQGQAKRSPARGGLVGCAEGPVHFTPPPPHGVSARQLGSRQRPALSSLRKDTMFRTSASLSVPLQAGIMGDFPTAAPPCMMTFSRYSSLSLPM